MKKIALFFYVLLALLFSNPVNAIKINSTDYIYDETGTIENFFIKNINIKGEDFRNGNNFRVIYYVSNTLDADNYVEILDEAIGSIERGTEESVMLVGYSTQTTQFYVRHNEEFRPRHLEEDVANIRDNYFIKYSSNRRLGDALMQVYGYFCNIAREGYSVFEEKDTEDFKQTMRVSLAIGLIFAIAITVWSVTIRTRKIHIGVFIGGAISTIICILYILFELFVRR